MKFSGVKNISEGNMRNLFSCLLAAAGIVAGSFIDIASAYTSGSINSIISMTTSNSCSEFVDMKFRYNSGGFENKSGTGEDYKTFVLQDGNGNVIVPAFENWINTSNNSQFHLQANYLNANFYAPAVVSSTNNTQWTLSMYSVDTSLRGNNDFASYYQSSAPVNAVLLDSMSFDPTSITGGEDCGPIDNTAPTVEIQDAPASVTDNSPFSVTFEFSEDVTGFDASDLAIVNGSASNFATTDANTYTADITPSGSGDISINVAAGAAQDAASNESTTAPEVTVSYGATGQIMIRKVLRNSGIEETFVYSSSDSSFDNLSITTSVGIGSSGAVSKSTGTYTVLETANEKWTLSDINCTGDTDNGSSVNLAARSVAIDLDANEAITCTFTSDLAKDYVKTRAERVIKNFMARRADVITANEPNLADRLSGNRPQQAINGNLGLAYGNSVSLNSVDFATSFQQISDAISAYNAQQPTSALDQNDPMMGLAGQNELASFSDRFDVWVKSRWARNNSGPNGTDIGMLYAGVEYRHSPDLLIGILGQADWFDEENSADSYEVEGTGWMAGPYVVARIHQNLLFDSRVAWGQSENKISPLGTYTDHFDTERWLAHAQLTGDFYAGNWRFSPQVKAIYFEETQSAYTDSLGNRIDQQTVSLGRMIFGPEIGHHFEATEDLEIFSRLSLKGIWDFDQAETVDLDTGFQSAQAEDLKTRLEAGFGLKSRSGWSVDANGFYDGIGISDFETYGGSIALNIPLN